MKNSIQNPERKKITSIISKINSFIESSSKITFESVSDKSLFIAELWIIIEYLEQYLKNKNKKRLSENLNFLFEDDCCQLFIKYLGEKFITLQNDIKDIIGDKTDIKEMQTKSITASSLHDIPNNEIISLELANNILDFVNKKNNLSWNEQYKIEAGFFKKWNKNLIDFNIIEIRTIKTDDSIVLIWENQLERGSQFVILGKIDKLWNFEWFNTKRKLSNLEYNEELWCIKWKSNLEWFIVDTETLEAIFDICEIKERADGSIAWNLSYRKHNPNSWIELYDKEWNRVWESGRIIKIPFGKRTWVA